MAKVMFGASPTSKIIRAKLLNSAFTDGRGLTGLSFSATGLIISTIKASEASATYYTAAASTIETITTLGTYVAPTASKCRFKEVDATYHKGIYEMQFADSRFSATDEVLISIAGASGLSETDFEIQTNLGRAAYPNGYVYYDSAASNTNTVIGIDGLPSNPVSTPAAAKTLADALGTKCINITGTWTNTVTMSGYHFVGKSTDILNHNNTDMTGCTFDYLDLRGVNTGKTNIYYKVTTLNTYTIAGVVYESEIGNTATITGYSNMFGCQPTNSGAITLVFSSSSQGINVEGLLASSVTVSGVANAGSNISLAFAGNPDVIIDSSCTAGTITILGYIDSLTDNSTGATVIDNRNLKGIANAVWDEPRSSHVTSATFGENVPADLVKIDGQLTNGNNATLNLKALTIINDDEDAVIIRGGPNNGNGISVVGGGDGDGIDCIAGSAIGAGLSISGRFEIFNDSGMGVSIFASDVGISVSSQDATAIEATGDIHGMRLVGGSGSGLSLLKGSGGHDLTFETPDCTLPIVTQVTSAVNINSNSDITAIKAQTDQLVFIVDGISTSAVMSNLLSMASGKFSKDSPTPGDVTFYMQDNITPAFTMHITATQRTRTYQAP